MKKNSEVLGNNEAANNMRICMGFDALRICMGKKPKNYSVKEVRTWMEIMSLERNQRESMRE